MSNGPKKQIRVTVTSELPELKRHLASLVQVLVPPEYTWAELLSFHHVPIDTEKHKIKSSRNTALLDEQIQATALHFSRESIRAQIVILKRLSQSSGRVRRRALKPQITRNSVIPGPNARWSGWRESQNQILGSTTTTSASLKTSESPTSIGHDSGYSGPHATPLIRGTTATASASRAHGAGPVGTAGNSFGVDNNVPLTQPQHPQNSTNGIEMHIYAESIDSEAAEDEVNPVPPVVGINKKDVFLQLAARVPSADFDVLYKEIQDLKSKKKLGTNEPDDSFWRWSKKTPSTSHFLQMALRIL